MIAELVISRAEAIAHAMRTDDPAAWELVVDLDRALDAARAAAEELTA